MDLSFLLDKYNISSIEELQATLPLILRNIALDLADEAKRRNLPLRATFTQPCRPDALDLQPLDEMRPMAGGPHS